MPLYKNSTREYFVDHPHPSTSLFNRAIAVLPPGLAVQIQRLWDRQVYSSVSTTRSSRIPRPLRHAQRWNPQGLLSLPHLLVAVWALLLLWGERWAFERAVEACEWKAWERWVSLHNLQGMMGREADEREHIAQRRDTAPSCLDRRSATH